MNGQSYDPSKITKPIQLSAAWFVTLLVLEGTLLAGASKVANPSWAAGVLVASAIAMPLLAGSAVFLLQTRYRGEQLADPYYAELLRQKREEFRDFAPEVVAGPTFSVFTTTSPPDAPATEEPQAEEEIPLEKFGPVARPRSRNEIYPQHHDLFLTHSWRPSTAPGQVADIVVRLFHHPDGRLPKGFVEKVEYDLGPAWGGKLVRRNANQDFRLEISAYGSVLCVCTVYFSDGTDPIEIYRYLDFTP